MKVFALFLFVAIVCTCLCHEYKCDQFKSIEEAKSHLFRRSLSQQTQLNIVTERGALKKVDVLNRESTKDDEVKEAVFAKINPPEVKWDRTSEYGIYKSTQISQNSKRVAGATTDVHTQQFPDDAELIGFDGGKPDWVYTASNVHISVSRHGNTAAAVTFDDFSLSVTVVKWTIGSSSINEPDWTFSQDSAIPAEDPIVVSQDGTRISVLLTLVEFLNPNQTLLLQFDKSSKNPISTWRGVFGGRHITSNSDSTILAFHANTSLFVYDARQKEIIWTQDVHYSDDALAISADGRTIVAGFIALDVYKWNGKEYALIWTAQKPNHFVNQVALSGNGNIAVGWSSFSANSPSVEAYNVVKGNTPLITFDYGVSQQLQDVPWSVSITDDGNAFVVGTWGNMTESNPTVRVFSIKQSQPIWTMNTVGSVFSVDITSNHNDNTVNVAVACKGNHANIPSRGGKLYFANVPLEKHTDTESK